jgi:gluconolactonase
MTLRHAASVGALVSALALSSVCRSADFKPEAQAEIVAPAARLQLLWAEGEFTEGPALAPDDSIVFSDIGNTIYRFDPKTNKVGVYRAPSGRANGLMFTPDGRLVACEGANTGGGRRISIRDSAGKVTTLSDNFEGKRFNSPNDLAISPGGVVYFTDPRYVGDDPRELDFEGVFSVQANGATRIATREVVKPNGILISADGKHAFVADNDPRPDQRRTLLAFDIDEHGDLIKPRALFDFGSGRGIDGMTLDSAGNIYATAGTGDKAGVYVFSPQGKHLAFLPTPGDPTNCVFGGGKESHMLYITAAAKNGKFGLYRLPLKTSGSHASQQK